MRDATDQDKHERATAWLEWLWTERAGRLSVQVLEEYYVTVTQKLRPGLPVSDAQRDVHDLFAWRPLPVDTRMVEEGWSIQDRFGLSFWDALVAAATRMANCRHLLPDSLAEGRVIEDLVVVNPFTTEPSALA